MIRFGRSHRSIRWGLLVSVTGPLLGLLAIGLWISFDTASRQAGLVTDRLLTASARVIAEDTFYSGGKIEASIPPAALEMFASESRDRVVYRVIAPDGSLVAGYSDLKPPAKGEWAAGEPYPYDVAFRAEQMRAVEFPQPIATPNGIVIATVLVAETVNARGQLFRSLWFGQVLLQALLVAGAAALIWIGINRELGPLLVLADNVRRRRPDEFEPIPEKAVQLELRPLIVALNDFMARLERQVTRQRDFLDTAAHQLRTPLSVLKMQVEYALRAGGVADKDETLRAIDGDLSAVGRLTNQLLVMARSEHDRATMAIDAVDLSEVAREVITTAAPRALDAGIDIGLDAPGPCVVPANSQLIGEMVRNLVDNVILYAGSGSTALVSVRTENGAIRLRVADSGRGVRPEDRGRIFERFQRGRDAPGFGSGLGLSIVSEIAALFGGSVTMPDPIGGKGFVVEITFPLPDPLPGEGS